MSTEETKGELEELRERLLWKAARYARWILRRHWAEVEAVRKASMKKSANGYLTGEQVVAVIEGVAS